MSWPALAQDALVVLYGLVTFLLAGTGLYYGLIAVERVVRTRSKESTGSPTWPDEERPRVTVQVPVYNERHVVGRLLRALVDLEWPADKLQVQVIDDSTDETSTVVAEMLDALGDRGVDVEHIRRQRRDGYKAGAVEQGLETATGEFVAMFDADFVPPPDFLVTTIPHFSDPAVGCVQTRWEHLNESQSWFTRAQAMALDAHFAVEQWVRAAVGSLMSFNATSCVWRRETLDDVGGWSSETVAEDLDLTAQALLSDWEFVYTEGYAVPCEIPVSLSGFVRQQTRWARGSTQNVRKHLGDLLWTDGLTTWARFHSVMHVCHYLFYPLLLAWIVLHVVVTVAGGAPEWLLLAGFLGTTPGPVAFLLLGLVLVDRAHGPRRLLALLPLTLVGIGIAWRMTRATVSGFLEMGGRFDRTPKFGGTGPRRSWGDQQYDQPLETVRSEVLVGGWCVLGTVVALGTASYRMAPSIGFFTIAYVAVAWIAVRER
jgi:cellulose synthase/poly-beta-1,6-N-acetylglucosamine synthase-like glycosyltransferase